MIGRMKLKYLIIATVAIIILKFFGVFTHIFEKDFYNDFHYPYDGDVHESVEQLRHNIKPDITPINTYNYSYLINADTKCKTADRELIQPRLVYIVKSAMAHFDRRIAIRNSWGYEHRFSDVTIRTVFMLGINDDINLLENIKTESQKYGDIVQANFFDSYFNNTVKTIMGFKWAVHFCPLAKFYMFVDDDMYVSTKNVLRYVRNPTNYPAYLKEPVFSLKHNAKAKQSALKPTEKRIKRSLLPTEGIKVDLLPIERTKQGLSAERTHQNLLPIGRTKRDFFFTERTKLGLLPAERTKQGLLLVERAKQDLLPIEKTKQGGLSAEKTNSSLLPFERTKQEFLSVERTKLGLLPAERTKQGLLSAERTKQGGLSAEKTNSSFLPVERTKREFLSAVRTKLGLLPAERTNQGLLSAERTKQGLLPIEKTKRVLLTAEKTNSSLSPVERTKRNLLPTERPKRQVMDFELPDDVRLYSGYVFISAPHRHKTSKWHVALEEYPYHMWPPYVTAGSYILSREALHEMYYTSYYTKHFRFDDVYLGLVAMKANIEPYHCNEFHFYKIAYSTFGYAYVIASHGYEDPDELLKVWNEQKSTGHA